jgi:hypothetical protein
VIYGSQNYSLLNAVDLIAKQEETDSEMIAPHCRTENQQWKGDMILKLIGAEN